MKLPSLNYLAQSAGRAFIRFPFSIIAGILAAGVAIYMVEAQDDIKNFFPFINLLLTSVLGISLFFCADVFAYDKGISAGKRLLIHAGVLLLLIAIYFSFPGYDSTQNTSIPYIRYGIYNVAAHLLVAFIPFLGAGKLNGFWHYNRILFVRILAALLYSGVLYAGLAAALGSLDFLFDVEIHEELFADLFFVIAGVFNTWFFLAGIPSDFQSLDELEQYPKGIKIFAQYVLLSLLVLYLVILYIYAGKIVVMWSWPKGLVSYLVAAVAVLGILTLLLIHPYSNLSGNVWIRKFSRVYYFVLLPLIALLFYAIGLRVSDYGVTINRYAILLLGVWLTLVSAYFIAGKRNIKFIPISLAVILVFVSFGFWGIFSVSERSQVARLQAILEQANMLKDGKIQREVVWLRDSLPKQFLPANDGKVNVNEHLLSDSLFNEVRSIVDYLDDHHGFKAIRGWYDQNLDSMIKENANAVDVRWRHVEEAVVYMRTMGLPYTYKYKATPVDYFVYTSAEGEALEIGGYDYLYHIDRYDYQSQIAFQVSGKDVQFVYPKGPGNEAWIVSGSDTLKLDVGKALSSLVATYGEDYESDIPRNKMTVASTSESMAARLQINYISLENRDSVEIQFLRGFLLIKLK